MKLQEIHRLLPGDDGRKLCQAFGGTRVFIPRGYSDDHPLVELLGVEAATRLIRRFGGTQQSIPMAKSNRKRDEAIRNDWMDGMTKRKIALKYGLSERSVHRICWARISRTDKC